MNYYLFNFLFTAYLPNLLDHHIITQGFSSVSNHGSYTAVSYIPFSNSPCQAFTITRLPVRRLSGNQGISVITNSVHERTPTLLGSVHGCLGAWGSHSDTQLYTGLFAACRHSCAYAPLFSCLHCACLRCYGICI